MSINTQSVFVMETGPAVSPLNSGGKVVTLEAAGQWTLICQRFLRHKIAAFAAGIILVLYLIGAFAEFLAPGLPNASRPQYTFAPPQRISLFTHTDNAGTRFLPHVKGYRIEIEPKALRRSFVVDEAKIIPIGFFVKGAPYKLWGVIPMETHLVGPLDAREPMYLLGSDRLGRDLMSRL
ncbi:peptide ABC transporter permease, partial [Sinorhizobium medicae]